MRTDEGEDPFIEPTQPQRRPGAELARARDAAGIGLRAMADTLHLPERQVSALENDDYANLPPPTFVRGYLRSYARALGLDSDEIVGLYDTLEDGSEDPGLRLSGGRHDDKAHNRGLALAIGVLALAVAVSLGAWWWQTRTVEEAAGGSDAAEVETSAGSDATGGGQGESVASAEAATAGSSAGSGESNPPPDEGGGDAMQAAGPDDGAARSEGGPAPATNEANSQTTLAERGSATQSSATASGSAQNTAGDAAVTDDSGDSASATDGASDTADVASSANTDTDTDTGGPGDGDTVATLDSADADGYQPPTQTSSAETAVAPEAAEGPEQLQVNVDGRSWIEIYDARGRELVYTLYTGSAPLRLRGWAPFDVFLGNSPDVSIRFNGNAVEKAGFTRSDNTARFLVDASGANPR